MSVTTLQWAVTGYSLVGAAVIVTSGSLGDVFGRKRVFQLGLLLFVASCVLIALVLGRDGHRRAVHPGRRRVDDPEPVVSACSRWPTAVKHSCARSRCGARPRPSARRGPAGSEACWWASPVGRVSSGSTPSSARSAGMVLTTSRCPSRGIPAGPAPSTTPAPCWSPSSAGPLILALSQGSVWGWGSLATIGCFVVTVVAGYLFAVVERRVEVPLLDLALLRNRILVGATIAILIGAGTINGLMYLLSLYFQDPATLGFSPLQAGIATLPATAGLVAIAAFVPKLAARVGGRQVIGARVPPDRGGLRCRRLRPVGLEVRRVRPRRSSPSLSAWACPTARRPRPRRRASPRTRSAPPRGSRTWLATWGQPSRPRSPRRSTAP